MFTSALTLSGLTRGQRDAVCQHVEDNEFVFIEPSTDHDSEGGIFRYSVTLTPHFEGGKVTTAFCKYTENLYSSLLLTARFAATR
jgi:hypothetical protein